MPLSDDAFFRRFLLPPIFAAFCFLLIFADAFAELFLRRYDFFRHYASLSFALR